MFSFPALGLILRRAVSDPAELPDTGGEVRGQSDEDCWLRYEDGFPDGPPYDMDAVARYVGEIVTHQKCSELGGVHESIQVSHVQHLVIEGFMDGRVRASWAVDVRELAMTDEKGRRALIKHRRWEAMRCRA